VEHLVYLIPLFPLVSFVIIALFGKNLSKSITTFLAPGSILASFVVGAAYFLFSGINESISNRAVVFVVSGWRFPGRLFFSG
jgi:hypothetical protein